MGTAARFQTTGEQRGWRLNAFTSYAPGLWCHDQRKRHPFLAHFTHTKHNPLLKTKQRSLKIVLESKSFKRAAMGTERTAFRAGSPESKASGQNAGPSLTLCKEDEALLSWKLTYATEVIPRGLWSGLKYENCQHTAWISILSAAEKWHHFSRVVEPLRASRCEVGIPQCTSYSCENDKKYLSTCNIVRTQYIVSRTYHCCVR